MHARLILPLLFLVPAVASAAETIDPARIVSAATGDWNKDGDADLARAGELAQRHAGAAVHVLRASAERQRVLGQLHLA